MVFTSGERAELARLPSERRRRRAVELWTLKEAYLKARSLGLFLPVERVEVVFRDGTRPMLQLLPPIEDDPARRALSSVEIEQHLVSICAEVERGLAVDVRAQSADLSALLSSSASSPA